MSEAALASDRCMQCAAPIDPTMLACPACARLVHAETLKQLATEAESLTRGGSLSEALARWRRARELLPQGTTQREAVDAKLSALTRRLDEAPRQEARPTGIFAKLGAAGLVLWKLKFIALWLLTKGKLLLFGFSKASTLLSMFAAFGVYWALWGWAFAAGFVLSIYVHEMGHVAALRRYGYEATAPMFVPGLGAFVRLKQAPRDVHEDARIGLAGPIWGLGAALACRGAFHLFDWPLAAALAHTGAYLNLFNLLPAGSLDGGRGFRALNRAQRWWATAAIGAAWFVSSEPILLLLLAVAALRAFSKEAPAEPDRTALVTYVALVALLAVLLVLPAPRGR